MRHGICLAIGMLLCVACGNDVDLPPASNVVMDAVVPCPCMASGTVTGTIEGREFTAIATGLIKPTIGNLQVQLFEMGSQPVCYQSGKIEIPDGAGTRIHIGLCLPPLDGERVVGANGGPPGTLCSDRPMNAGVVIADPDDVGTGAGSGTVEITSATAQCVSGTINVTKTRFAGGAQITESLRGTFTVPNSSCYTGWTDAVFKYCPM